MRNILPIKRKLGILRKNLECAASKMPVKQLFGIGKKETFHFGKRKYPVHEVSYIHRKSF